MTVAEHCVVVGLVARALMERLPAGVRHLIPDRAASLIAAHDVGKVSPGFQRKYFLDLLTSICPEIARSHEKFEELHAEISESAFARRTGSSGSTSWSSVLGAHHGTRKASPYCDDAGVYGGAQWSQERQLLLGHLEETLGPVPTDVPTACSLLVTAGLTCVSDWLGSDESVFPAAGLTGDTHPTDLAERALDDAGWVFPTPRPGLTFRDLFEFSEPNAVQQEFVDRVTGRGVFVLEAPTGCGKTEAALWATYQLMERGLHGGFYFALPTRMASDRIHKRITRFLRNVFGTKAGAALVHAQAWLKRLETGGEELAPGGSWFNPRKRALLYPFGVGTIDQALLSVLPVKHAFVRWLGLAGKVVILDEVHSYDMYTGTLLDRLVEVLRKLGATVIILSATLTRERRESFFSNECEVAEESYPLITGECDGTPVMARPESPESRSKAVTLDWASATRWEIAERVCERAESGEAVLWISNTVEESIESFRALKSAFRDDGPRAGLLHARFPAWRREQLEELWLEHLGPSGARGGCVLVGTQVLEQSIDVDSDYLVSALAPTDMLVQRLGRLWRHVRSDRCASSPGATIWAPALGDVETEAEFRDRLGATARIYAPYVLWRTWQLLHDREIMELPRDVRSLLESTYSSPTSTEPDWVAALRQNLEDRKASLKSRALGLTSLELPALSDDDEIAPTRIMQVPTIEALLVRGSEDRGSRGEIELSDGNRLTLVPGHRDFAAARHIHRNLVRVPRYLVEPEPIPSWLGSCIRTRGLVVLRVREDARLVRLDGAESACGYTDELGVFRWPSDATEPERELLEEWDDESDL